MAYTVPMPMRLLLVVVCLSLMPIASVAQAADAGAQAELLRLQDEIDKLSARNRWSGVERTYHKLTALKASNPSLQVPPELHLAAAQAAISTGDITTAHRRLVRAVPDYKTANRDAVSGVRATALSTLDAIEGRYGHVEIEVSPDRVPGLVRFEMPFTREERKAIEFARVALKDAYKLQGFLPVGRYMVDGTFFTVEPGAEVQRITVGSPG